ncbi:MAG: EamA family transporter [Micavibrio sp.]|nr:EamA family transporter [Micavibrio sp.]|tara:strand:- start:3380 stop:4414 length:1035 start_codon:yes stop_codon:yes gene_type:complete
MFKTITETPIEDFHKAVAYALGGVFVFSLMAVCIKYLTIKDFPIIQIVFFRCFFGMMPVLYMLTKRNDWDKLLTTNISGHLSRSLIGLFSMFLTFWSFAFLPLADATALQFVTPIAMTMLAVPLLNEKVGPFRWFAVMFGFAGVVIMIQPGGASMEGNYIGLSLALCAAVLAALAMIIVKKLGETESSISIVFYFTLISTLCSGAFLTFYWRTPDSFLVWAAFIGAGLLGGIGQIWTTRSYQYAPAAFVSPFSYLAIIYAVIFGIIFFGEHPNISVLLGSAVVIASGILVLWREYKNRSDMPRLSIFAMQPARPTKQETDEALGLSPETTIQDVSPLDPNGKNE